MTSNPESADHLHALGVLTRSATHDLNNYMAAILSFAELVLEEMPQSHPVRSEIEGILAAGHRAVLKTRELDQLARKLAPIGRS